jgi:hypothetical protein
MAPGELKSPDPLGPFTDFWSNIFECVDTQNKLMLEFLEPTDEPQNLQKRWLEATSRAIDAYLRSPAFLRTMQTNMRTVTYFKTVQDQFMSQWARSLGLPLSGDIHELADRLRRLEGTLRSRLNAIEEGVAGPGKPANGNT